MIYFTSGNFNPLYSDSAKRGKCSALLRNTHSSLSAVDYFGEERYWNWNTSYSQLPVENTYIHKCYLVSSFEYADEWEAHYELAAGKRWGWYEITNYLPDYFYAGYVFSSPYDFSKMRYVGFWAKSLFGRAPLVFYMTDGLVISYVTVTTEPNDWKLYLIKPPRAYSPKGGYIDFSDIVEIGFEMSYRGFVLIDDIFFYNELPTKQLEDWLKINLVDITTNRESRVVTDNIAGVGESVQGQGNDLLEGTIKFLSEPNFSEWKTLDQIADGENSYFLRSRYFNLIVQPREIRIEMGETYKGMRASCFLSFVEDVF